MSAYKDEKRGSWYAKFRYTDWQGNRKETTRRGFATKREAKEFEVEFKRKIHGAADMNLNSLYEVYMEDRKQKIKLSSLAGIKTSMKKHVLPALGNLSIGDITPNVIRKWQNDLAQATHKGKPLAPPTILNINRRFAAVLNFGVKYYGIARNPMTITGTQGESRKRLDFWNKVEFDKFLEGERSPLFKAFFMLLYYSGMRAGEALALTNEDIDFTSGKVTINKTYTLQGTTTPPKTKSSNRVIMIPAHVLKVVYEAYTRLSYKTDRIFDFNYPTAAYHFRAAIKKSGVRKLNIHSLRHAHASLLIAQGVPITAVSKRLGHSSPQITLSIYAHASEDSEESIAKLLNNF